MNKLVCILIAIISSFTGVKSQTCSTSWCTSTNGIGGTDCWAGNPGESCSCSQGVAKLTGNTQAITPEKYYPIFIYEYTCCLGSTEGDKNCGLSSCSFERCTSPGLDNTKDCYAGSENEPCACEGNGAGGWGAVEMGPTAEYKGNKYYEYTCCPNSMPLPSQPSTLKRSDSEFCGDYKRGLNLNLDINLNLDPRIEDQFSILQKIQIQQ